MNKHSSCSRCHWMLKWSESSDSSIFKHFWMIWAQESLIDILNWSVQDLRTVFATVSALRLNSCICWRIFCRTNDDMISWQALKIDFKCRCCQWIFIFSISAQCSISLFFSRRRNQSITFLKPPVEFDSWHFKTPWKSSIHDVTVVE